MKKLTIEEKAARYDEVIETFDVILNLNTVKKSGTIFTDDVRKILPELKESEDERIRKNCIHFLEFQKSHHASTVEIDECIAWLEKQGEKSVDKLKVSDELYEHIRNTCACIDDALSSETLVDVTDYLSMAEHSAQSAFDMIEKQGEQKLIIEGTFVNVDEVRENFMQEVYRILNADQTNDRANQIIEVFDNLPTVELEKQGEQKLTDKVEPKFKVGDWIMSNVSHEDYRICKILKIENGEYVIESIYGYKGHNNFETFDKDYHLWTTQDAKDGDVLVASDGSIFLFKGVIDGACKHYVALTTDNVVKFNEGLEHYWETSKGVHPAIKEQRDLLFQKMHEVGYEWDAEKKELKKIEQTSAWSEEDEEMEKLLQPEYEKGKAAVIEAVMNSVIKDKESAIKFLKSAGIIDDNGKLAKEYVADNIEQNPAWSEEDEKMIARCIDIFEKILKSSYVYAYTKDCLSWLNSIKERYTWKPSDEQIDALYTYIYNPQYFNSQDPRMELVESVYKDLKKLREE